MLETLIGLDQRLFEFITLYANQHWLTQAAEFWVRPEKYLFLFIALLLYTFYRSPKETFYFLIGIALLLVLTELTSETLKHIVARPRPGVAMGIYHQANALSFPSAHSLNTMAAAVFYWRYAKARNHPAWWGYTAISYSIFVGCGRVIANYHFLLDVFAGWALGALLGYFYYVFFQFIRGQKNHKTMRLP